MERISTISDVSHADFKIPISGPEQPYLVANAMNRGGARLGTFLILGVIMFMLFG
jgi:hypothetical protein